MCTKEGCSVKECCKQDIPLIWLKHDKNNINKPDIDPFISLNYESWLSNDENEWFCCDNQDRMVYVDLEHNKPGYTGYVGEKPRIIWNNIHNTINLLHNKKSIEYKILNKIISGFHALVNVLNYAHYYGVNKPNIMLYEQYINEKYLDNLYFNYVLFLRSFNKISKPILINYNFNTGNTSDDSFTNGLINYLSESQIIKDKCNQYNTFNEYNLFTNNNINLMNDFRNAFKSISKIIDCVECSKCKLHGKLTTLGIGTALKILFTKDKLTPDFLERNEIIAFINIFGKYSDALSFIKEMNNELNNRCITAEKELSDLLYDTQNIIIKWYNLFKNNKIFMAVALIFIYHFIRRRCCRVTINCCRKR